MVRKSDRNRLIEVSWGRRENTVETDVIDMVRDLVVRIVSGENRDR
jgi:hypothetical protein